MKLHRKIKHNENVCCAQDLGSYARSQGHNQVRGQNCVSAITQKLLLLLANFTKLRRKIEDNEKVCHSQDLGSFAKVKVTIRSEVKNVSQQ